MERALIKGLDDSDIGGLEIGSESDGLASAARRSLSDSGMAWDDIRAELLARKKDDYDWRGGRVPIYVYHDGDELLGVSREAYGLYFSENALGRKAFPSVARMEDEVVEMALSLFNAPQGARGSFTSGGTESVFLALKTAKEFFHAAHGGAIRPNIVIPRTAHPVFDKAAGYLEIDVTRVGIRPDLRADVDEMRQAMDGRTMLIAGSAPCYPFGVFDPIAEIAELAVAKSVWLHVDACLGGFLAPFVRDEGHPVPEFDFAIPGVTSLSADLHKYGFSARGASVVLYREGGLKEYQPFRFENWPRGSYCTDTFLGSRPGGTIASAWAVMHYLGRDGYRRLARKTMDAKRRLIQGIEKIRGLEVIRPTELSILLYKSVADDLDLNAVAEQMIERGWFVGRSREPLAIHMALNAVHAPAAEKYLHDLREVVRHVRESGRVGSYDDSTY